MRPGVERGHRRPVKVAEHAPQDAVQVVVSVGLPGCVAEERGLFSIGDPYADAQLEVAQGRGWVELRGLI